ncbi:MAG: NAD(P)H-quinone oxidoreductase [Rhizobiaceae bacterium]|nr:NAD(P)H-quinone oxidoreductase [Rhizobiaceae bacterium]
MRIAALHGRGGPEVLVSDTRPVPVPGPGEILIEVFAAGVNRPDVLQRMGLYPAPAGAPDWPGLEVSGTVAALGEGASRFRKGALVMALLPGGGYAEYAVVDETNAMTIPFNIGVPEAAGVPETFFTVWHNVFQRGGLKAGERILVHGGTSGIGTTAIQLADAFGAEVFVTAGSADKCEAALQLGAHHAIDYRTQDFVEVIAEATKGQGVDLILDMVGGDYTPRNLKAAAIDGRIVQIAFLRGQKVELDLQAIMVKRLTLTGSTLRARSVAFKASIARELEEKVVPLLTSGRVKPLIDSIFPLAEAAAAHRRMDEDHIGKILLEQRGDAGLPG